MAETIENNLRRVITDEKPINPKYYEKMSALLDTLIRERKAQALAYEAYLARFVELARQVKNPASSTSYPTALDTRESVHSMTTWGMMNSLPSACTIPSSRRKKMAGAGTRSRSVRCCTRSADMCRIMPKQSVPGDREKPG